MKQCMIVILFLTQTAIVHGQTDYERQQLLLQERALAETERANRAREAEVKNAQTLQSMKMLTDQLNQLSPAPTPPPNRDSYQIHPQYPSPGQDPMAPGSYFNPMVIENK